MYSKNDPPFVQSPYEIRRSSLLSPDPERAVTVKNVAPKTSNGPCKCCKCCTWKCCAISQTVILCIIGGKYQNATFHKEFEIK